MDGVDNDMCCYLTHRYGNPSLILLQWVPFESWELIVLIQTEKFECICRVYLIFFLLEERVPRSI